MTANRAAEFARLAARAESPSYRRFWLSQAEACGEAQDKAEAKVGNSEPLPGASPRWRAANEPAWAALFDALGVAWKYEALEPDLSRALRYVPDFWLTERLAWFEVKSAAPTPGEFKAARDLLAVDGHRVYIVTGWPKRKRYGVWVFAREGEAMAGRSDWADLTLCNLLDVSFGELWRAMGAIK